MKANEKKSALLSLDELSVFCYQLGLMLKAGIGSEEAVGMVLDQTTDPGQRAVLSDVQARCASGDQLWKALGKTGRFPDYLVRMVEIGTVAGRLDEVMPALADYYRRESVTESNLRSAVRYPAVMAALIAVVFLVLMVKVLPVFSHVFSQLGISLSPAAAGLLGAGSVVKVIAWIISVLLIVLAVVLILFTRQGGASAILSMKGFSRSEIARSVCRTRFFSAMALMLKSGLPLDESAERAAGLLERSPMQETIAACRDKMAQGVAMPEAAGSTGLLSAMQASLLSAGFKAGVPDQAMGELAQRCQEESDRRLSAFLSRFEYGLVAVLCVAVGLVLLSVMLPLLGVLSAIGG